MSAAPQHKNKFFCIQLARHFPLRMKLLTLGILKTSFRLLLLNRNFENYASHECRLRLSIRTSSSAFSLHDIFRFA